MDFGICCAQWLWTKVDVNARIWDISHALFQSRQHRSGFSLSTLLLLHLIFFVCLFVGLSLFSVFVCGFEMQITCLMKCLAEDNSLFVCVELKCRKSDLGHKL